MQCLIFLIQQLAKYHCYLKFVFMAIESLCFDWSLVTEYQHYICVSVLFLLISCRHSGEHALLSQDIF